MRRLKTIIKRFRFEERNRSLIVLGAGVRLSPTLNLATLVGTPGTYSTDDDLFVKTWISRPRSAKRWIGFHADYSNFRNAEDVVVTSVGFRLSDGTTELYWDGAAWTVAGAGDWNTENDVSANIASYPIGEQRIQVVVNLKTTNNNYAPVVYGVRLAYESDVEEMEDLVWRSFVPSLRAALRPIGEYKFQTSAATTTIDLSKIETPYNIVGLDSVYNLTADPDRLTELSATFDANSKVVTLSSSIASGQTLVVRFNYQPIVAVTTSPDYDEFDAVPCVVIEDMRQVNRRKSIGADYVLNKATLSGRKVEASQSDIELVLAWYTDKGTDHARLSGELRRYFESNQLLTSVALDEKFRLWAVDWYEQRTAANRIGTHAGRLRCRIVGALFYDSDASDIHGVKGLDLRVSRSS